MFKNIHILILTFVIMMGCTACADFSISSKIISSESNSTQNVVFIMNTDNNTTCAITEVEISEDTQIPIKTNNTTQYFRPTEEKTKAVISSKNINTIIDENLDTIMKDNNSFYIEQQFIDAHPNEFAEIVSLGEEALPYLKDISGKLKYYSDDQYNQYRCIMATFAAYKIKPELYDLVYPSPDGKYAIKASINSFFGLLDPLFGINYNDVRLIESETNSVIAAANANFTNYYTNINIEWSSDSRYASISQGDQRYFQTMAVFDVSNAKFIILPYEEIENYIKEKLPYPYNESSFYSYHLKFDEWTGEDIIKVKLIIDTNSAPRENYISWITGWYTYDLIECKVIDINYETQN